MIRGPPRSTRTDTLFPYTTLFRSGGAVSGAPQSGPSPTTTLITPGGNWSATMRAAARVAKGASSAALITTLLPATSAGATFSIISTSGTFHGRMAARSEEHTSELQSLIRISYAVFCLKQHNHTHS